MFWSWLGSVCLRWWRSEDNKMESLTAGGGHVWSLAPHPLLRSFVLSFYFLLLSCLPSPRGAETQRGLQNGVNDRSRLLRYHLIPLCSPLILHGITGKKNTLSEAVNTRPHTYATPTVLVFHPAVQCSSRLCTSVDSSRSDNSIRLTNPQTKPPGSLFCLDETETVFLCLSAVCVRILTVVTDRFWMCVCWIERSEPWGWRAAWTVYPAVVSLFTRQMTAVQRPSAQ